MTHLPSYKSFNFHEVEEIENRVFCPHPAPHDHALKVCPGSLSIQDDIHSKIVDHVHHSKWRRIQHNVSIIHPNKSKDPEIVHMNENFLGSEQDLHMVEFQDSEEDLNLRIKSKKYQSEPRNTTQGPNRVHIASLPNIENLEIIEDQPEEETSARCFVCRCKRKKRNYK